MRLIELTADRPSFRTIRFKPEGISLIVGGRSRKDDTDSDKTYNGVGKSLAIALIHFCLGSNKVKAFQEAIPDWEFGLTFESGGVTHRTSRNTSRQGSVIFDGQEMKVNAIKLSAIGTSCSWGGSRGASPAWFSAGTIGRAGPLQHLQPLQVPKM